MIRLILTKNEEVRQSIIAYCLGFGVCVSEGFQEAKVTKSLKQNFPDAKKEASKLSFDSKAVKSKKEVTKTIQVPEKPSADLTYRPHKK